MPEWSSKAQVQAALTEARKHGKEMRAEYGPDSKLFKNAIKECNAIQQVLDRWDAINS